jgi:hypothetical protein
MSVAAILDIVALAKSKDFVEQALAQFKSCFYHGRCAVLFWSGLFWDMA